MRYYLVRLAVMASAGLCTSLAGAASIKATVNSDPAMCAQLLHMVKAAGVPSMTDEQLCDFRFDQLPKSVTGDFTFPVWQEMTVDDPVAMFDKMRAAPKDPVARQETSDEIEGHHEAVRQAAAEHNLVFYKTALPIKEMGRDTKTGKIYLKRINTLTVVRMDTRRCSIEKAYYGKLMAPFYVGFQEPDLGKPIDIYYSIETYFAFWKSVPVGIEMPNSWVTTGSIPTGIWADMGNLSWSGVWLPGGYATLPIIRIGQQCSFIIDK